MWDGTARSVVLMDGSSSHRLEASAALWEVHVDKPSTHVLTPLKLGALREVARDNILVFLFHDIASLAKTAGPNVWKKIWLLIRTLLCSMHPIICPASKFGLSLAENSIAIPNALHIRRMSRENRP